MAAFIVFLGITRHIKVKDKKPFSNLITSS